MTDAPRATAGAAETTPPTKADRPYGALAWALGALVAAVVLAATFPAWRYSVPYGAMLAASYLLTWGPLAIALAATAVFWRRFLGFRAVDIYLGLMIGVVGRAVGIVIQFLATGRMPSSDVVLGGVTGIYFFTAVIAPVILAPLIEEPFFRGLLQGSLGRIAGSWGSWVITAAVFTVVHTIADGWSWAAVATLFVFALLAGYVTQRTKRLAPAIVGHATFNGLAALITWPW